MQLTLSLFPTFFLLLQWFFLFSYFWQLFFFLSLFMVIYFNTLISNKFFWHKESKRKEEMKSLKEETLRTQNCNQSKTKLPFTQARRRKNEKLFAYSCFGMRKTRGMISSYLQYISFTTTFTYDENVKRVDWGSWKINNKNHVNNNPFSIFAYRLIFLLSHPFLVEDILQFPAGT